MGGSEKNFWKNFWHFGRFFSGQFSKIDPDLKNFDTYHPTFYTPIDRSRRALQLCSGSRGEWVKFRLRFWSIFEKFCCHFWLLRSTSSTVQGCTVEWKFGKSVNESTDFQRSTQISKTLTPTTPLSTHQSRDLGELYNFVVEVEIWGWSFVYTLGQFLDLGHLAIWKIWDLKTRKCSNFVNKQFQRLGGPKTA